MKEEPEEGGAHAAVAGGDGGIGHDGANGRLERRAARGVERRRELAVGCGGEEEKGEEQAVAARGRSHGVLLAHDDCKLIWRAFPCDWH